MAVGTDESVLFIEVYPDRFNSEVTLKSIHVYTESNFQRQHIILHRVLYDTIIMLLGVYGTVQHIYIMLVCVYQWNLYKQDTFICLKMSHLCT